MNLERAINNAIEATGKCAARAIAKVTAQATRYDTQEELDAAYREVLTLHNRTINGLRTVLEDARRGA